MGPKPRVGRHRIVKSKAWPSRAGSIVDAGISVVEVLGAKAALDAAQSMKGDENAVIEVASKWREAGEKLSDSEDPIQASWHSLTASWEGGAYDAFQQVMTRNATVAAANAVAVLGAENFLLDLAIQVANAYNLAVDLTTLAASRIEPALGGISLTSNKKDDKPTITKALQDYVEAINKVDTSLRTALATQRVGLAKFTSALSLLKEPGTFPENAEDPKGWIHR